jgi:hypothetical protein
MLVGKYCTNIHFLVKFRNSKIHNFFGIALISLKLGNFTKFNPVFPVVLLVFDEEFSEGVINSHFPPNNEISKIL